jgi:hypothetical protein
MSLTSTKEIANKMPAEYVSYDADPAATWLMCETKVTMKNFHNGGKFVAERPFIKRVNQSQGGAAV